MTALLVDVLALWLVMAATAAGATWATGWHRARVLEDGR